MHRIVIALAALVLVGSGLDARADLAAWDQAKVAALAKQLSDSTRVLYDTFYAQPMPTVGSMQGRAYYDLKQNVRRIRSEAQELAVATAKSTGHDETRPIYENLMEIVRDTRDDARQVFTTSDVAQKAADARAILKQLGPYYVPTSRR